MNINVSQGSEPLASKIIIILMCILYVLGPLHLEVNSVLHTITHALEKPNVVLVHEKTTENKKIHRSTKHEDESLKHEHEIIDLVQRILKGSDPAKQSRKRSKTAVKIDKHITLQTSILKDKNIIEDSSRKVFWKKLKIKLQNGYKSGFKEPPRA